MNLHIEALGYFILSLIILYGCGEWLCRLLVDDQDQEQSWAWSPLLGLAYFTTALSYLSYLGIPVKVSTPLVLIAGGLLTYLTPRKLSSLTDRPYFSAPFFGALGGTLLFLGPYVFTGGFPFFGDEFTYVSIADFIRDHGYFASAEPADEFPWKSQMLLYRLTGLRMGMQYLLAGVASLVGGSSVTGFVPVTAACLYCCYCAMWLFLRATLPKLGGVWLGFFLYTTNLMMVQWPAAINLLPQTGGMGLVISFFASIVQLPGSGFRSAARTGLLLSAACLAYSEMLPMLIACAGLFTVGLLLTRETPLRSAVMYWLMCFGTTIVANPYMLFYSIKGILIQSASQPGLPIDIGFLNYLRMSFGLFGPVDLHPIPAAAATGLALVMGAATLGGFWFVAGRARVLLIASAVVFGGLELYFSSLIHYSYGAYKILLYSYYLLPVLLGAGLPGVFGLVPQKARLSVGSGLALGWFCLTGLVQYHYLGSSYDTTRHARYAHRDGPGRAMTHFSDLEKISGLVRPGERTLQFIPEDDLNKWASYYFRNPVGLFFKGPYFSVLAGRRLPADASYDYLLLNRKNSAVADRDLLLFENDVFVFSRMQSFISLGEKGWHDWEDVGGKPMRWMSNKAELYAYASSADKMSLALRVHLGPDGKKKSLIVSRAGKELARAHLPDSSNDVVLKDLALEPGVQTLEITTDISAVQTGSDQRILNVLIEPIQASHSPSRLSTQEASQRALISGVGLDGWVLAQGIEFGLGVKRSGGHSLLISGELPGIPSVMPQQLLIEVGTRKHTVTITTAGSFIVKVPLGTLEAGTVQVRLKPLKSLIPKALGINEDPRSLAFHLNQVELQRD